MTQTELDALASCPLPRDTPFAIGNVSTSQFSVARHYGGITFQGQRYTYNQATDYLVRDDVMRWLAKQRKAARKAERPKPEQGALL